MTSWWRGRSSPSPADLERHGSELEERERGLAQREAAIDASGTTEQLAELRAELDRDRVRYEQERE